MLARWFVALAVAPVLAIGALIAVSSSDGPRSAAGVPLPTLPPHGVALVVNTTSDFLNPGDGTCSLRAAITATNANVKAGNCDAHSSQPGGTDGISFDIGMGTPVINITTPLPAITAPLTIDGSGPATRVELHGPYSGTPVSGHDGLDITGSRVTISNMVIDNFEDDGIKFSNSYNFLLTGSYIGTNGDGTAASGNAGFGVQITGTATIGGATDGGACSGDCNLISGNAKAGVFFDSGSSVSLLQGSFIGTDVSGKIALPNGGGGVEVKDEYVDIGETRSAAACTTNCNLISGNHGDGILFDSPASHGRAIGNYIGTDITGTAPLGNGGYGVDVASPGFQLGDRVGTTPGGSCTGGCNLIAANGTGVPAGETYANVEFEATATGGLVEGNFVGLNDAGTAHVDNGQHFQQGIEDHGSDLTIGGTDPTFRNVISGESAFEIAISGNNARVKGNYIGLNSAGTAAIPMSGNGIVAGGVTGMVIGGATPPEGNVISGAGSGAGAVGANGISFIQATGAVVERNLIGTAADGISPVPNVTFGVSVQADSHDVTIGGSDPNTIMFNGTGVFVGGGPSPDKIRITGNSIDNNTGKGIELGNGANHNQAAPVIQSVQNDTNTTTHVVLSLTSAPNTDYQVDLYDSPVCDSSGFGEGRTHGATVTVHADGSGVGHLDAEESQPGAVSSGVAATATDPNGNTSEFSNCRGIQGLATPTPSPTPIPTPTGSASPTPTGTPGESRIEGDVNCDTHVNVGDFEFLIEYAAGVNDGSQTAPCPDLGQAVPAVADAHEWGDLNCDGSVNAIDALLVLAHTVQIELPHGSCPPIGSPLT